MTSRCESDFLFLVDEPYQTSQHNAGHVWPGGVDFAVAVHQNLATGPNVGSCGVLPPFDCSSEVTIVGGTGGPFCCAVVVVVTLRRGRDLQCQG